MLEGGKMEHIAYCDAKAKELEKIIIGEKTMIIRGANGRKIPYGRVFPGDTIYFLENDGKGLIKAKGVISEVINSEKLSENEGLELILSHQEKLRLTKHQLERWSVKRYLCLIKICEVNAIRPFSYNRTSNMDDWIIVNSVDEIRKNK
jgi:hypothetical protein